MANVPMVDGKPDLYVGDIYRYHVSKTSVGYWMCISASDNGEPFQFIGITDLERVPDKKILENTMKYNYGALILDDGELEKEDLSFYLAEDNLCTYSDLAYKGSVDDGSTKTSGISFMKAADDRDIVSLCNAIEANAYFNSTMVHIEDEAQEDENGDVIVPPKCGMVWWELNKEGKPVYPYYTWLKPEEKDATGASKWPIGYMIDDNNIAVPQENMKIPNRCRGFLKPWAYTILNRSLTISAALRLPNLKDMYSDFSDFIKTARETARDKPLVNIWQMTKQETPIEEEFFDEFDPEEENRRAYRLGTGMFLPKTGL